MRAPFRPNRQFEPSLKGLRSIEAEEKKARAEIRKQIEQAKSKQLSLKRRVSR